MHVSGTVTLFGAIALIAASSLAAAPVAPQTIIPSDPSSPNVTIGPATVSEPFNCWTDGAFGLTNVGGTLYGLSPVREAACGQQYVWSGSSVLDMAPAYPATGITYNTHTDRGRVYDTLGWWPFNLWVDTSTNPDTWYSYMHTEDESECTTGSGGFGADLRTIATWISTDAGATWEYDGVAVSLDDARPFTAPADNCHSQEGWPKMGGTGDNELVVGDDGYLYLLYTQFVWNDPNDGIDGNDNVGSMGIARSAITDHGEAGTWEKYYNGAWGEPGDGGHETYVMSPWIPGGAKNEQRSVAWNDYLEKYVMVFWSNTGINISYSDDLIQWTAPDYLYHLPPESASSATLENGIAYMNLVGTGTGADGTTETIGQTAWLYYVIGRTVRMTGEPYQVERRLITFTTDENLAAGKPTIGLDAWGFGDLANATDSKWNSDVVLGVRTASNVNYGWLGVDLGSATDFNTVVLQPTAKWGYGFPTDFVIEGASSAGGPWTTLTSIAGLPQPRGDSQTFDVGDQNYRYVRIAWNKLSNTGESVAPFQFRLAEFEVYDKSGPDPVPTPPSASAVTADASTDFSGTQGQDGWFYSYRAPERDGGSTYAHWAPLSYNSGTGRWVLGGNDISVGAAVIQPGASGTSAARVWRAPADGVVHITGNVAKQDVSGGDGVQVHVAVNRNVVWPVGAAWQAIGATDSTGYNVDTYQQVKAGDRVLFVVDALSTSIFDTTAWDPTVDYVPTSTTTSAYSGFDSTQGTDNWSYKYWNGSSYTNLTWDAGTKSWVRTSTATAIGADWMHPDTSSDAVRTWTAPSTGVVAVTGQAKKGDVTGGDGVQVQIRVNGTVVWPSTGGWQSIGATDAIGVATNVSFPVTSGDQVRFVVNRISDSGYDTTIWPVTVTY